MSLERTDRKIVHVAVARLRPHPRQSELFPDRPDWQLQELADDMAKNGQLEDVEVLPDNRIVSGHRRVEAARRLNWRTVRCWVRHDLATAGDEAIERRLLEANLYRRQLSPLTLVRCYRRVKEITRNEWGTLPSEDKVRGDLRDLLAERFGKSGRTLDRWCQILDLALPLQQAVECGALPLTLGVKIVGLSLKAQSEIAERLSQGEPPRKVVNEYLKKSERAISTLAASLGQLVRSLRRARQDLADRIDEVHGGVCQGALDELQAGKKLIAGLIAQIQRRRAEAQERIDQELAGMVHVVDEFHK
jgi:hypothetical protein